MSKYQSHAHMNEHLTICLSTKIDTNENK